MTKHCDKYIDGPANEKSMERWLFHLLRDWVKGTTDKAVMEKRFRKLMNSLRTSSNQRYAMKRTVEMMKDVDRGMVALYDMIEEERK